ncbi:20442_t:CDS:2 [Cetraspora pellucida]|uniref:20442_t:CDS:1 n=1 Tax=Cetraspora pellucida TaxID=1433469 RepID=A0A9N9HRH2_9GLOM|nr:20442_t:CDS:2 [Cetraspora pellucida]
MENVEGQDSSLIVVRKLSVGDAVKSDGLKDHDIDLVMSKSLDS